MNKVVKASHSFVSKSARGFSIPELMIVVLVALVLCFIALPQLSASLKSNRINTLNAVIASKLSEARIQAIKRNSTASLKVNFQTRKIWIESGGAKIGGDENYTSENSIEFSSGADTTQGTVTFNSFGNLQTSPATINVKNVGINLSKALQVSVSGKITVSGMTAIQ